MASKTNYSAWSNDELVDRITSLEQQVKQKTASYTQHPPVEIPQKVKKPKAKKDFDFSKYTTRFIALKFAYLGQKYNGLEHHTNNITPLPTIEEVLWKALTKTKLIAPTGEGEVNWEGCDYSKCGRTDKGVSAFGQVISLRVRSNRPRPKPTSDVLSTTPALDVDETVATIDPQEQQQFDPIKDEIPYARLLNRVLPDDIRILAWCPNPPANFSARFSCRERRYRYFFTQPAYAPRPDVHGMRYERDGTPRKDGWLDLDAMREAASHLIGLHDFRNLCKVDASKQITNFERRITHASIDSADSSAGIICHVSTPSYANLAPEEGRVYTFTVHGSAFLYHQVRHMVAVLFLVGLGLEKPSLVLELLDITRNPTKPMYEMADDAPLVLWDCVFPDLAHDEDSDPAEKKKDALEWLYADGEQPGSKERVALADNSGRFGPGGVQEVAWSNWRRAKIDEVLAGSLLDLVAGQTSGELGGTRAAMIGKGHPVPARSTKVFDGGNNYRFKGDYVPVMQRERMDTVEVMNARYSERKRVAREAASPRRSS